MSHDTTKRVMGGKGDSDGLIKPYLGTLEAGIVGRLTSAGAISTTKNDGNIIGLSVGKDGSDAGYTGFWKRGLKGYLKLTAAFTPVPGTQVHISDTTGLGIAAGGGATGTNATYKSGLLVGLGEDGLDKNVAEIDAPGGF